MSVTINGIQYEMKKGESILEIAKRENIYIPTLCTHHELPAFGACRMCLVEVEGGRGPLPACTTPIQEGMVIRTKTEELQVLRRGIMELILSEHTSACIVCKDKGECKEFKGGPIKTGRVTGCRFCPEDQNCELIKIADYVGLEEIRFPFTYKEIPSRRDDPFIERDPNLCILCGRCVRVCSQLRGREAISFLYRGHRAEVGTSFGKPLMDVGCMFCGACVDVCPTGSLSSRSTKWHGEVGESTESVCLLCGAQCQFGFESKWDKIMAAVPWEQGRNRGQGCVRGRFCLPPLMNGSQRLKYPLIRKEGELVPVDWDEALGFIKERLATFKPGELGFLASPYLSNESAFLFQKLARQVLGSPNIDTVSKDPARGYVGALLDPELGAGLGSLENIENAEIILIVGSDLYLDAPLLTVSVNRAKSKGAKTILLDSSPGNQLAGKVDVFLKPEKGAELPLMAYLTKRLVKGQLYNRNFVGNRCRNLDELEDFLEELDTSTLAELSHVPRARIEDALRLLHQAKNLVIIAGDDQRAFTGVEKEAAALFHTLLLLAGSPGGLVPVLSEGNALGVWLMGVLPGHGPGLRPFPGGGGLGREEMLAGGVKGLYLCEPLPDKDLSGFDFLILQAPYPHHMDVADVVLPSATFTEEAGSTLSLEGFVHQLRPSAKVPGMARADWEIFMSLGKELGKLGFDYQGLLDIQKEFGFTLGVKPGEFLKKEKREWHNFMTTWLKPEAFSRRNCQDEGEVRLPDFCYRGTPLAEKVPDFKILLDELKRRLGA